MSIRGGVCCDLLIGLSELESSKNEGRNFLNRLFLIRGEDKISSRLKHGLLSGIAVIALFITFEHGYGAIL
jgi:hypothetical protein